MCQNSPLVLGWVSVSWFRVAEILKYTYPGWYNSTAEQQLVTWFESNQVETLWKATTLIDPSAAKAQYGMGNWHSTMIEGLMNYYFLKSNVTGLNYVIQYYQRMVNGSNLFPPFYAANGEECELCRDVEHANYGIGSLVQIAESFWHQGIDLYSYGPSGYSGLPGLAQVIETTAYVILNNNWPPNITSIDLGWGNCTTFLKNTFTPGGFYIGYNHYSGRLGLKLPNTQALLGLYSDTAYYFNWGLGVLTHSSTGLCDSTLGTSTISPSASPSSTGISVTTSNTTSKYSTTTMVTGIVGSIVLVSVGSIFLVLRKRYRVRQPSATHPPNLQQIKSVFVK
ncbi:hypothetical protein HK103_001852 [Boothiomyces macroporosus]|uniref:Alginate lyase domain-containing protein n=1 Tax=Boothiomyces macroporosus TaxID=261099 RepID=A0AAD5UAC4_9FUNG|nr:hypothetical protein HK103_001852 [Boothiomyces macroporosus]